MFVIESLEHYKFTIFLISVNIWFKAYFYILQFREILQDIYPALFLIWMLLFVNFMLTFGWISQLSQIKWLIQLAWKFCCDKTWKKSENFVKPNEINPTFMEFFHFLRNSFLVSLFFTHMKLTSIIGFFYKNRSKARSCNRDKLVS